MKRGYLQLLLVVLVLGAFTFLLVSGVYRNDTARRALCFQREDIDARIAVTHRILKHHPHSRLIFGIPRSLILQGYKRDRTTRQNLRILAC